MNWGDHAVEAAALVSEAFLASAESAEVLGSLGNNISTQLHGYATEWSAISSDIEVNTRFSHFGVSVFNNACGN